jgi:hypothetical protein
MCPSVPSFPTARVEAERPNARREYEHFDQAENWEFTVPAGTVFVTAVTFSGRPDLFYIRNVGTQLSLRFREPGEAGGPRLVVGANSDLTIRTCSRIVEVLDPAGGGGQFLAGYALYHTRNIDRRESRRGPLASDVRPREQGAPEQLEPR